MKQTHPCVQCELANASEAFLEWLRSYDREAFAEFNCSELTALRAALAAANAQHGRA